MLLTEIILAVDKSAVSMASGVTSMLHCNRELGFCDGKTI